MSTHSDGSPKSLTAQELDAWLLAAKQKRLALHVQATGPWDSLSQQEAFAEMSCLLEEAFEEVRVVSESLREGSRAVRGASADLRTHSTQLMERGTTLIERMSQFVAPSPEKLQQAESAMLEMFKGNRKSSEQ
jgi:hypothetical protein